jgi:hypothetical protein
MQCLGHPSYLVKSPFGFASYDFVGGFFVGLGSHRTMALLFCFGLERTFILVQLFGKTRLSGFEFFCILGPVYIEMIIGLR